MDRKKRHKDRREPSSIPRTSARTRAPGTRVPAGSVPARDVSITLKVSPQEYQLISYAASRSRARGVQTWMRDRVFEAARAKVPRRTAEDILEGRATADLLRESLREGRAGKTPARILPFATRRNRDER